MKDILFQYNPWWEGDLVLSGVLPRKKYQRVLQANLENRHVIFLTGLRRVDDYLLRDKNLLEILAEYRKIHRIPSAQKTYVFFDEITHQKDYQNQPKNLYDTYNLKIFASASSSSLLRDSALNDEYFRDYIRVGGMPENVLDPRREYLMNLVDDIIQKDITEFYGIKNSSVLRDFFFLLMERSGKQVSINKLANILGIAPDTSRRYLAYFQETFLIHLLPRHCKTNETLLVPKKLYAGDLGMKHLFIGDRDFGSYFENYIYLQLQNRKELYYLYEDGIEIDFITSDGILVEAKYNASLEGRQKELFDRYPAVKELVIDSVDSLSQLSDLREPPLFSSSLRE